MVDFGEVAERSNATDCKSVALAASEVRILPSPPALFAGENLDRRGFCQSDGWGHREWQEIRTRWFGFLFCEVVVSEKAGVTQW